MGRSCMWQQPAAQKEATFCGHSTQLQLPRSMSSCSLGASVRRPAGGMIGTPQWVKARQWRELCIIIICRYVSSSASAAAAAAASDAIAIASSCSQAAMCALRACMHLAAHARGT